MNKYPKGSEWRRWDLHVHTPESHGFIGDWEQFKEQIQKSNCEVIGINDYFSVNGYKKLKQKIDEQEIDIGNRKILPVVEFRMTDTVQNRNTQTNGAINFNFHIIFNDSLNITDIELFIRSLECNQTCIGSDYDDKEKLKDKKISFKEAIDKLNKDTKFKDNFIIWLPYDEYGGIGDIDPNSDGWIKQDFIKKSHILGSSNQKQIDFFLWKSDLKEDGSAKFSENDFRNWFVYKKPCIKGSDSHSHDYPIGKLKNENSEPIERFCWIKADPTFEGLKQIIYEAEDRVKIQESKPDEKSDYQIIDKVKFVDDNFTPEEIQINQNLTAIIGGKSTGKSILLKNIAQTVDAEEVRKKIKEFDLPEYKNEVSSFKVIWRDQQENKKNENANFNKRIIYIPQSYLNRLVDKKEDKTTIDEIIKNVLCQDENTKKAFEMLNQKQKESETNISKLNDDIFFLEREANSIYEIIKNIGDKKGIETEIQKLKIDIESLKKISGMSQPEIESYNKLAKEINEYKGQIDVFTNDLRNLDLFKTKTVLIEPDFSELSKDLKELLTQEYLDTKIKFVTEWKGKVDQKIVEVEKNKNTIENNLRQKYTEISPLVNKVKESKSLNEKIEKLKIEESKLKEIVENENKLQHKRDEYKKVIETLAENVSSYYDDLFIAKSEILKQTIISGEISFDISVEFRKEYFQNNFVSEICNLKTINQFENGLLSEYLFTDNFKFKTDISKIISNVLNGKIILKANYDRKEALRKLVQNWYIFDYKIKQNGDELSSMSPGKKSFVLLKLLIELDNSKCPILLDQPEDDLDNRSIYKDLVKFIKTKKKERQIIIVTHNPNLVVGADAECIIVANQSGENSENKTYKFEYISGSLENTFIDTTEEKTLYKQGIQEHVCDILEGGEEAFRQRKNKYNIN